MLNEFMLKARVARYHFLYDYRWSHKLPLKFIGLGWDSITKLRAASWQQPNRLQVSSRGVLPPTKPISEQPCQQCPCGVTETKENLTLTD